MKKKVKAFTNELVDRIWPRITGQRENCPTVIEFTFEGSEEILLKAKEYAHALAAKAEEREAAIDRKLFSLFSAVFAGRVVSVRHSYDSNAASVSPEERTTVGFEVSAVWKGTVHEDMYVTTPPAGGSCGVTFIEGDEYIVYGYDSNYDDGGYTVGICSRTALLGQAQADLDAFGEGHAPQAGTGGPAPEQPQDTAFGWAWTTILVAAATVILVGGIVV